MTLAVLAPSWLSALAGFALVGLGASNIVPVLYSALGRQRAMPAKGLSQNNRVEIVGRNRFADRISLAG